MAKVVCRAFAKCPNCGSDAAHSPPGGVPRKDKCELTGKVNFHPLSWIRTFLLNVFYRILPPGYYCINVKLATGINLMLGLDL